MWSISRRGKERGLYDASGELLLEAPTQEQLKNLPDDSKVLYFTTLGNKAQVIEVTVDKSIKRDQSRSDESLFTRKYVTHPLASRIRQDLPGLGTVGIRGTASSLDGSIPFMGRNMLRRLDQILAEGSDTPQPSALVEHFDLTTEDEIKGMPYAYLHLHPRRMRRSLEGIADKSIFPLLLVYDLKFEDPTHGGIIWLPKVNPSQALLKAYIVDFPHY